MLSPFAKYYLKCSMEILNLLILCLIYVDGHKSHGVWNLIHCKIKHKHILWVWYLHFFCLFASIWVQNCSKCVQYTVLDLVQAGA